MTKMRKLKRGLSTFRQRSKGREFASKIPLRRSNLFIAHSWNQHGAYLLALSSLMRSTIYNFSDLSIPFEVKLKGDRNEIISLVQRRLRSTQLFVLIHDPTELLSDWVHLEIKIAEEGGLPIVEAQTTLQQYPMEHRYWNPIGIIDLQKQDLADFVLEYQLSNSAVKKPIRATD